MDISLRSKTFLFENRSWLGSAHGTDATQTITLDVSTFTAGTHYPNGFIPSGIVLAKITASGMYGPYVDAGTGGLGVMIGFLFSSVEVQPATTTIDVGAAILLHGVIVEANLPSGHGLDAAGKTDMGARFTFR